MSKNAERKQYEIRLRALVIRLFAVRRLHPREQYLHRVMDGVPFQDLETALMLAEMKYEEDACETGTA
jgi:hypothetical protein